MVMSGRVWQGNNGEGTEVHGDVEQLGGAREQRMLGGVDKEREKRRKREGGRESV